LIFHSTFDNFMSPNWCFTIQIKHVFHLQNAPNCTDLLLYFQKLSVVDILGSPYLTRLGILPRHIPLGRRPSYLFRAFVAVNACVFVYVYNVTQVQMSTLASVSSEVNKLSSRSRDNASNATAVTAARSSKSVSTLNHNTRSFPASPRTHVTSGSLPAFSSSSHTIVSLPTFCSSLRTNGTNVSALSVSGTTRSDILAKKPKVEVDLTAEDEFENDDADAELMMMMAQTTEQENYTCSSSCSSNKITDKRTQTQASSRCSVLSSDSNLMSSRSQVVVRSCQETSSRSASDSGINSSSMTYNVAPTGQFRNCEKSIGFTKRHITVTSQPFTYLSVIMKTLSSSAADIKDSVYNVKVTDVCSICCTHTNILITRLHTWRAGLVSAIVPV